MMAIRLVDLQRQYNQLRPEIDAAIARVLAEGGFILGEDVFRFEEEFARYVETSEAVGVDSGLSALELGLRALGIGPGDEVIVPAHTFIASASAVSFVGATPVFVDIDPRTYTINIDEIEQRITSKTKAIMAVHLYGQAADLDGIAAVGAVHGLAVVEDACQAHGARYKGHRVGALGSFGAFSFYPAKNLGAYGDGGVLVTNDPAIAQVVRRMRNYGQDQKYHHVTMAWNRRLDTIQAAALRVKLQYLDRWNSSRRRLAALYAALLSDLDLVQPVLAPYAEHVYHLYVIRARERDALRAFLAEQGIETGIHYPIPIHLQPAYAELKYRAGDFPVTETLAQEIVSLPLFPEMTEDEVETVALTIRSFLKRR
jgi:dTDP-4-amino-4,6-dideoxygalactose transaminase